MPLWLRGYSGALHENAAFTGTGFLNVTSGGPTPLATTLSGISRTAVTYKLGAGSLFVLLGTNNILAPSAVGRAWLTGEDFSIFVR